MKKVILVIAIAGFAVSCKKVPQGGNKGVLKMEGDVHRYSDDEMKDGHSATHEEQEVVISDSLKKTTDTVKVVKTEKNH